MLGVAAIGAGLAGFAGVVSWTVLGFGVGAAVITGGAYLAWERNIRDEFQEQLSSQETRRSLDDAYGEAELRDRIIEWSKTFPQEDIIRFHPNDYKADSIRMPWGDDDDQTEELWYFYSSYGFNNQPIVVYIEATTGEIKGRKAALSDEQKKQFMQDPFRFCDRYNEFREHRKQRTRRYYGKRRSRQSNRDGEDDDTLPLSEGDPR